MLPLPAETVVVTAFRAFCLSFLREEKQMDNRQVAEMETVEAAAAAEAAALLLLFVLYYPPISAAPPQSCHSC